MIVYFPDLIEVMTEICVADLATLFRGLESNIALYLLLLAVARSQSFT
jgi:hypothetical protein